MKKSELKLKLKARIDEIDDKNLLTMLDKLLPAGLSEITEEELKIVEETQNRFLEEHFYTQEQMDEMLKNGFPNKFKQN